MPPTCLLLLIDQPSKIDNLHVKVYTNEYSPSLLSLDSNINPNESASQVESPADAAVGDTLTDDDSDSFRKPKSQSAWVWSQYKSTTLETTWTPKEKGKGKGKSKAKPVNDRLISCTRCTWTTKDSNRYGSTTNMIRHLESKHDISQSSTASLNEPLSSGPQSREDVMKALEKNMTQWVVSEDMAFTSIESPSFRKMINDIPGISMPFKSRNTLSSRISAEFELDRARLFEELAASSQTVALSLDGWTSANDISILAVIGHWLSEDFVYKEAVLEFSEIEGPKSGENMGGLVMDLLEELNIETKLLSITGDNASNNETLMDAVESGLQDKFSLSENETNTIRFQGRESFIRCLAHVLNLIVKKLLETLKSGNRASALESIRQVDNRQYLDTTDSALARLRVLALWISDTPERKSQWRNICRDLNLSSALIPYDVDTRWNSTYLMVEAGIKAKRQISRWISSQSEMPQFTDQDWGFLGQIAKTLRRFYDHTLYISQSAPKISYAVPIYYDLHDLMHDAASREGEFENIHEDISDAVNSALDRYSKYYDYMDGQDIYYIALILNPRYKTQLLEQDLGKAAANLIIQHIKKVLHQQYPPIPSRHPLPGSGSESSATASVTSTAPSRQTLEARLLAKIQRSTSLESDIDRYFDHPVAQIGEGVIDDPNWLFDWWKAHKNEYPRMAVAARDYLAIPASEVSCERLFSAGRDMIGLRRHSLKASTMRQLALLRNSMRRDGVCEE